MHVDSTRSDPKRILPRRLRYPHATCASRPSETLVLTHTHTPLASEPSRRTPTCKVRKIKARARVHMQYIHNRNRTPNRQHAISIHNHPPRQAHRITLNFSTHRRHRSRGKRVSILTDGVVSPSDCPASPASPGSASPVRPYLITWPSPITEFCLFRARFALLLLNPLRMHPLLRFRPPLRIFNFLALAAQRFCNLRPVLIACLHSCFSLVLFLLLTPQCAPPSHLCSPHKGGNARTPPA